MPDRSGLPPTSGQAQLHTVRVENVEVGRTRQVRCLSHSYGGIGTHYVKGASRYCKGDDCRPDWHRTEWYYRGYFAGELFDDKRKLWLPCVWELTEQSELDVRGRYQRGQVWEFSRAATKDRTNPPVMGKLLGSYAEHELPPGWDYRTVLMRIYHTAAIDTTTKNPMPPRLLLAPSPFCPGFKPADKPADENQSADSIMDKPRMSLVELSKNGKGK